MQLKITTDYAIRVVIYLAERTEAAKSYEISKCMRIPDVYIMKVLKELKLANIITSLQGKDGGYKLNKSPNMISLYDIIECIEGNMKINRCLEEEKQCNRNALDTCPVHGFYCEVQEIIDEKFKNISIVDLI